MKNLKGTGLKHNPCQGCEAYYTRPEFFGQCIMEIENACSWIVIYNNAPNQSPDADTKSSGDPDNNPRKDVDIFHAPML